MNFPYQESKYRCVYVLAALAVVVPCLPAYAQDPASKVSLSSQVQTQGRAESETQATDDGFMGPRFRKGLWKFVRTLDIVRNGKLRFGQPEKVGNESLLGSGVINWVRLVSLRCMTTILTPSLMNSTW